MEISSLNVLSVLADLGLERAMVLISSHSFSFLRYVLGLWVWVGFLFVCGFMFVCMFFYFCFGHSADLAWWLMPIRFSSPREYGWHVNTFQEAKQETYLLFKFLDILSLFHLFSLILW